MFTHTRAHARTHTHTHTHKNKHSKKHITSIYNFNIKILSAVYAVKSSLICIVFLGLVKISQKISTKGNKWLKMDRQGHPVILHSSV